MVHDQHLATFIAMSPSHSYTAIITQSIKINQMESYLLHFQGPPFAASIPTTTRSVALYMSSPTSRSKASASSSSAVQRVAPSKAQVNMSHQPSCSATNWRCRGSPCPAKTVRRIESNTPSSSAFQKPFNCPLPHHVLQTPSLRVSPDTHSPRVYGGMRTPYATNTSSKRNS